VSDRSIDSEGDDIEGPTIGKSGCILNIAVAYAAKSWSESAVLYATLYIRLDLHQPWRAENHGKSLSDFTC